MSGTNPVFLVRKAKKHQARKMLFSGAVMISNWQMPRWIIS